MWILSVLLALAAAAPAPRPRARDLGVPFDGTPGTWNAITDVPGVAVGHETIVSGEGKLVVGKGPVRTGVTALRAAATRTAPRPPRGSRSTGTAR